MSQSILVKKALAESLKTYLRRLPFSKITVEDICEAAQVSRRSSTQSFRAEYSPMSRAELPE